jgi:hypothetical protein
MKPNYWLVDELVDRLSPIVPDGFHVLPSAGGDGVFISATDPPVLGLTVYVGQLVEHDDTAFERNVIVAIRNVLDGVHDFIADESDVVWPTSESNLGDVDAEVELREGSIHLWYGERSEPMLELRPITLPRSR